MAQSEQDNDQKGIISTIAYIGWAVLIFHLYIVCNGSVRQLGIPLGLLDRFIISLNKSTHLFDNTWASKLAALFMLLLYTFVNKGKKDITASWGQVYSNGVIGLLLLFGNVIMLTKQGLALDISNMIYTLTTFAGFMLVQRAGGYANQIIDINLGDDPFNKNNESFEQESGLKKNDYSVNIPTEYFFKGKIKKGWINVINPFRASIVLGTPGSGKSFAIIHAFIEQHIMRGFSMYIYDFKFPDLSMVAFHYLKKYADVYREKYGKIGFYVINFDDPRRSHRCNPLLPSMMTDIADAVESSQTILLNLNKSWIQKQGDFFVESPINFFASVIWFLKRYNERMVQDYHQVCLDTGREPDEDICFCTFPHAIEFASRDYEEIFPIMMAERELESLMMPFSSAFRKGALEQLEGQIASARIPLARLASPLIYWVMTGNDFSLDLNNPDDPKILCVGNNPDRKDIYGAALGLYNARILRLVNRKGRIPCSIIIDELPTIYFRGLDDLIATARSNKVSTMVGVQDLTQLKREYGDKVAPAIFNTIGNVFSGAVKGETAKALSSSFGKNVQLSQSVNFTEKETTTNISTRLDALIPESVITNLSQGSFVGSVSDNFGEEISQKVFHGRIVVNKEEIKELSQLEPIPANPAFKGLTDSQMDALLQGNFNQVKDDVGYIIQTELHRIRNHETLKRLLNGLTTKAPNYLDKEEVED